MPEPDRAINPRCLLLAPAALFVAGALLVTPERLLELGPMRSSLTSQDPQTRETALVFVTGLRLTSLFVAVTLAALAMLWTRVAGSALVESTAARDDFNRAQWLRDSRLESVVILALCALAVVYARLGEGLLGTDTCQAIAREDGVLEWGTALFFAAAAAIASISAVRAHGCRRVWSVLFALGFLVCVGEEISCGQRILGFETPGFVDTVNVQHEFNLHNLGGYLADHLFILGVLVYGCAIPIFCWGYPFFWKLADRIGFPVPSPSLACAFLVISLAIQKWSLFRLLPCPGDLRPAEAREFLVGLCFAFAMLGWLRVTTRANRLNHPDSSPQACAQAD